MRFIVQTDLTENKLVMIMKLKKENTYFIQKVEILIIKV